MVDSIYGLREHKPREHEFLQICLGGVFSELPIDGYLSREHVDQCDQSRSIIFKRARDREFGILLQEILVD